MENNNIWYGIQVGNEEDFRAESRDYGEIDASARKYADDYPNEEIKIITFTRNDIFLNEKVIREKPIFPVLISDTMEDLEMFDALERFYNAEDGAFERGVPDKRYVVISHRSRDSKEYDVYFSYDEIPSDEYLKESLMNIANEIAELEQDGNPEYVEMLYEYMLKDFVIIDTNCFRK